MSIIGIDEVGRAASRLAVASAKRAKRRASRSKGARFAPYGAAPNSYLVGIDEVGRGALAGPIVVAAVAIPRPKRFKIKGLGPLRDSKRLTPQARESWFLYLKGHIPTYSVARIYPRKIERVNVTKAASIAASKALAKLANLINLRGGKYIVFLDGGLYLYKKPRITPAFSRTVIRGDQKFQAIKLASIVAKVTRDRYMVKLHKIYPEYRFDFHKGYGTRDHLRALRKYGPSEVHRLTFIGFLKNSKPKAKKFL